MNTSESRGARRGRQPFPPDVLFFALAEALAHAPSPRIAVHLWAMGRFWAMRLAPEGLEWAHHSQRRVEGLDLDASEAHPLEELPPHLADLLALARDAGREQVAARGALRLVWQRRLLAGVVGVRPAPCPRRLARAGWTLIARCGVGEA